MANGKALRSNQKDWQNKFSSLEKLYRQHKEQHDREVAEMKEQIRDLMFYIESSKAIENSADKEEIAGGTVTVGPSTQESNTEQGNKRRHRKKR